MLSVQLYLQGVAIDMSLHIACLNQEKGSRVGCCALNVVDADAASPSILELAKKTSTEAR